MSGKKILVIDDEESLRTFLAIMLKKEGYDVVLAENRSQAGRVLERGVFDAVITDVKLPDGDGIEILRHVKSASPETVVIVMTAFSSTETAIAALKLGAQDYLIKPFDVDEVKIVLRNALEQRDLREEVEHFKTEFQSRHGLENIIGRSAVMAQVLDTVRAVASTGSTVLLTGESGTGKELLAKALHSASQRRDAPFVSINCGALPEPLLESELFGHVKGAFTDAHQNKKGLFESAHLGTLFLDEIGETPPSMQVKLLRALQERRIRRVGGNDEIEIDVRVVGATNRSLEAMVREGTFREDLFYRLNVIPIRVPPLRERTEDIPLLADHFLRQFARKMARPAGEFTPEDLDALRSNPWPGNVRELENLVERSVALRVPLVSLIEDIRPVASKTGRPAQTSDAVIDEGFSLDVHLAAEEARLVAQALDQAQGDRVVAARLLGVNARGLRYLLSKHPEIGRA